ncbi:helix-turn-helix domain-containing protein [Actinomadura viridis]|uniref:DNA-binding transcriptional ArsR family regulator n=1 Tax=Actinomadura viridis TaxID=58110 RepID=A0A931GV48_9ACTN|nr:helix-turn-helix domain-containing protein [Actinomadura viridis]MBG6093874.1 DNA-binding transcriptional ArsR family regulator [Actinomadura viridis]
MEDDAGPVTHDAPERLKALSHPLRRRILQRLTAHGPATSTTLGQVLGESTGTTSYHLRQLEKYGFIEEIPERSAGRERWWRAVQGPRDRRLPAPEDLDPAGRAALAEVVRLGHAEDLALLSRLPEEYARNREWTRLSRGFTRMTEEGLAEFFEAYLRLLREYGFSAEEAPPGARPVHIRLFTLPADED